MKTGRPPLSDAEKKRRGTFDPRYAEATRVGRAEEKIVSLFGGDAVDEIPPPPPGLALEAAAEYHRWTRRLHETGRLTRVWLDQILMYAIRRHKVLSRMAEGKLPADPDMKACESFLKSMNALNVDIPTASQTGVDTPFKRIGFANRVAQGEQERLRAIR